MNSKLNIIFGIVIGLLFFALGLFLLMSSRFDNMAQPLRVIFSIFLFLYGALRMVRYFFKKPRDGEEE